MKKNRFTTQWPDKPNFGTFEAFTEPSMTEPDNSMSIPEIIARYTRGQGIQVQQYPWQSGQAAPEEGEGVPQDGTAEALLEVAADDMGVKPQVFSNEPAPEPSPDPAPEPAPTPAPAGA